MKCKKPHSGFEVAEFSSNHINHFATSASFLTIPENGLRMYQLKCVNNKNKKFNFQNNFLSGSIVWTKNVENDLC